MSPETITTELTEVVLSILPPPFGWVPVPKGTVSLRDGAGVYETSPFLMAKFPITYAQFQVFIDSEGGFDTEIWWERLSVEDRVQTQPGTQKWPISNHPRENVSWYDAVAFCRWLSASINAVVRLPTEVEWQWATQGTDGRKYPWGNDFNRELCNTKENGINQTTPVDKYMAGASPFGVIDMIGNVWEWCLNPFDDPPSQNISLDVSRVMRGGTYGYDRSYSNNTYREQGDPNGRYVSDGFRIAAEP